MKNERISSKTQNALQLDAVREILDENRLRLGGPENELIEVAYSPTFRDWLLWLESDEYLLKKTAGTPRNFAWAKALLQRWREAGRPHPSRWPETKSLHWLRPKRSDWPEMEIEAQEAAA